MKLVVVLAALALFAAVAFAAPSGEVRWGQFRIARLKEKLAEDKSDLEEAKKELSHAKQFAEKSLKASKSICATRIARSKFAVEEWQAITTLRGGSIRYHKRRHPKYVAAHRYALQGPSALRVFIQTCSKGGSTDATRSVCARKWAQKHPKAFARWRAARAEYLQGNYRKHLKAHRRTTDSHKRRLQSARAALKRAVTHRNDLVKSCQESIPKTAKRLAAFVSKFASRVQYLTTQIQSLRAAFTQVKTQRASREKQYQKFFLTSCKHIGGKHHLYYCLLDSNSNDRKEHTFLHCEFRRRSPRYINKMYFQCTK